ncbi:signal peptidase I [Prevotella communis]|uniref:Signal peptidase I n=1 Tax=Prevotella communis TaxID=2913614 RepID=A0A1H0I528_9BACT|nr:signal peptidase I [Prevotella communis]UKK62261.1 signal peptidase I [Prevotella communis]UKK65088.1 signal peptidase I [Prevotella communis]SDO26537.1 signal peptidase I [Prevotella communis]
MEKREKKKLNMKKQWTKFVLVMVCYLLFLYWVESWLGLLVVPFIYDAYISKKINWKWWQDLEGPMRSVMSWVDAIVFALVAVYFINQFFFQNYVIPSSSLEKSLLTGDYLFVSKVSYGPRIPETPLTVPLTQHTLPIGDLKSYIEWPHWEYRRVPGLGKVELNDIVVFNYPAGDTICQNVPYQTEYYNMCYGYGRQIYEQNYPMAYPVDSLSKVEQRARFEAYYNLGRQYISANAQEFGGIGYRPTDRRENYVKRCVGLPGDTLQIIEHVVYLNGKANKEPDNVQYTYDVLFNDGAILTNDFLKENGITCEDLGLSSADKAYFKSEGQIQLTQQFRNNRIIMPMTKQTAALLKSRKDLVQAMAPVTGGNPAEVYPLNMVKDWTRDNYGPVWIPKKGESIKLSLDNLPIYERPIRVYEHNDLEVRDGKIFINGEQTDSYTFKMDYYWMMGDNRHNSADSRYWGFVPEDHIVGKPIFIWWSSDPDRGLFGGGIRWSRLFRFVDNIK